MPECKSAKRDMRRRVARTRGSLGQERSRGWKRERGGEAGVGGWRMEARIKGWKESEKRGDELTERGCLWGRG